MAYLHIIMVFYTYIYLEKWLESCAGFPRTARFSNKYWARARAGDPFFCESWLAGMVRAAHASPPRTAQFSNTGLGTACARAGAGLARRPAACLASGGLWCPCSRMRRNNSRVSSLPWWATSLSSSYSRRACHLADCRSRQFAATPPTLRDAIVDCYSFVSCDLPHVSGSPVLNHPISTNMV